MACSSRHPEHSYECGVPGSHTTHMARVKTEDAPWGEAVYWPGEIAPTAPYGKPVMPTNNDLIDIAHEIESGLWISTEGVGNGRG
jgi:hypothetical protein